MSIIEGGSFKCDQGHEPFESTNPEQWAEHQKEHTESGTSVCAICGKVTAYSKKPIKLKPMCEDCKEAYAAK